MTHGANGNDRVWKVGSRWSDDGNAGSCILDLFRTHGIVFVGRQHDSFNRVRMGDLVAVSSGKQVVALGRALDAPRPFQELGGNIPLGSWPRLEAGDIGPACRIGFHDLKEEDFVPYRIGAFHEVHEKADLFRELHRSLEDEKRQDRFQIEARSRTLSRNPAAPDDILLKPGSRFRIPIFQRSYSWGEPELHRLLTDILSAFAGRNGRAEREPMFVGTMQLTAPKPEQHDEHGSLWRYDVIDGQQRLTTFALIMRAIQLRGDGDARHDRIDWLSTAIGDGVQQGHLSEALHHPSPRSGENLQNRYLENLKIILDHLEDDEALDSSADLDAFRDYLTGQVYFVVIETRAGLSKTLQIFESINTAGMDLDGGDVFKIRYYEYLRSKKGAEESDFNRISELYNKIARHNESAGEDFLHMERVLGCVKWIVSERLQLPYQAKELKGTTFFDRLFDVVLSIDAWEGFAPDKCRDFDLPVELIDQVIDAASRWREVYTSLPPESQGMDAFLHMSRYGNYHEPLVVLFVWRFGHDRLGEFIVEVAKMLVIYSLRFQRKTYDIRGLVHQVIAEIVDGKTTCEQLLSSVRNRRAENRQDVSRCLHEQRIAEIPRSKNLACRLVAFLDELDHDPKDGKTLCDLLFWNTQIDIEHIEAANHKDGTVRSEIHKDWGDDLHGLGNLTVLERYLNRSISNEPYSSHKRERYRKSRFAAVEAFAETHPDWSLPLAQERKARLAERLTRYLCGTTESSQT